MNKQQQLALSIITLQTVPTYSTLIYVSWRNKDIIAQVFIQLLGVRFYFIFYI